MHGAFSRLIHDNRDRRFSRYLCSMPVNLYLLDYHLNLSHDKSAIIKFLITSWYKKIQSSGVINFYLNKVVSVHSKVGSAEQYFRQPVWGKWGWWHCRKVPTPVCNDIQYKSKLLINAGEHWGFTDSEIVPEPYCSLKCPVFKSLLVIMVPSEVNHKEYQMPF